MKTIIAGSRWITDFEPIKNAMFAARQMAGIIPSEIVSGCASGVDAFGIEWAKENNLPLKLFPAEWGKHNRSAGPIRNQKMADYADALVAVWDGQSRGTKDMIERAYRRGLKVYIYGVSKKLESSNFFTPVSS